MTLHLYNSLGRSLQEFHPIDPPEVGLYACGPTVYNYAHIGNLRTYIFEDILRRVLKYSGYTVHHIMNVTDVGHLTDDADQGEDKMEVSAREKKMSVWEVADFYTEAFFKDTDRLNIERPEVVCRATDHIQDMIELIKRIEKNGYTYMAGGNLYFDVSRFSDYGKLALLDRQELMAGARIAVDENKRNPQDFVLWFTRSKFEKQTMVWDSPWGRGYPGWHIECSAMSMKYLGEQIDIHCGGVDHIPIHHTNEIAQSEAATGKKWVNYWLHGEFLLMEKNKMAKSAGNFITLEDLVTQGYDPLDYRYFCLGGHYRSQLQFSAESMNAAKNARENLVERVERLKENGTKKSRDALSERAKGYLSLFEEDLRLDLNIPKCLSDLWNSVKDPELNDDDKLTILLEMDRVFAINLEAAEADKEISGEELDLIKERETARENRDFIKADTIRDKLLKRGIVIEDTPEGTRWKRVSKK